MGNISSKCIVSETYTLIIMIPLNFLQFKLYIHHRDMMPGTLKSTELAETLARSRKIIILLSNSYIQSNECKLEADRAGV